MTYTMLLAARFVEMLRQLQDLDSSLGCGEGPASTGVAVLHGRSDQRYELIDQPDSFAVLNFAQLLRATLLLVSLITCAGCGRSNGLDLAEVTGIVKYNGEPVSRGQVVFKPAEGTKGPFAVGEIQPNGAFRMFSNGLEGAVVGNHTVTVHSRRELTQAEIDSRALLVPDSLIPERYSREHESPLTFQVDPAKENYYEIVLE